MYTCSSLKVCSRFPVGYDNCEDMPHRRYEKQTMVHLLHGYVSGWIGQMVSSGVMVEWTCDGQSVRDEGLTRLMRIYGLL